MRLPYSENQCNTFTSKLLMAFIVKCIMCFYPDYTLLVLGIVLYVGYQYCDISPMDKLLKYFLSRDSERKPAIWNSAN